MNEQHSARPTDESDYPSIDAAFKARWLTALRSGEYKQAQGVLKDGGKFCCLGVAACLIKPGYRTRSSARFFGDETCLADKPSKMIGLDSSAHDVLTHMNDEGADFHDIADWIERNL